MKVIPLYLPSNLSIVSVSDEGYSTKFDIYVFFLNRMKDVYNNSNDTCSF